MSENGRIRAYDAAKLLCSSAEVTKAKGIISAVKALMAKLFFPAKATKARDIRLAVEVLVEEGDDILAEKALLLSKMLTEADKDKLVAILSCCGAKDVLCSDLVLTEGQQNKLVQLVASAPRGTNYFYVLSILASERILTADQKRALEKVRDDWAPPFKWDDINVRVDPLLGRQVME